MSQIKSFYARGREKNRYWLYKLGCMPIITLAFFHVSNPSLLYYFDYFIYFSSLLIL